MKKFPQVGTGIFVVKGNKFLMGLRKSHLGLNTWGLIGGHLEYGESIKQSVAREVFEESGIRVRDIKILGVTNDIFRKLSKHYISIWIVCRWKSGIAKIKEPNKMLKWEWFDFDSLPKPLFLPIKNLLKSEVLAEVKKEVLKSK